MQNYKKVKKMSDAEKSKDSKPEDVKKSIMQMMVDRIEKKSKK